MNKVLKTFDSFKMVYYIKYIFLHLSNKESVDDKLFDSYSYFNCMIFFTMRLPEFFLKLIHFSPF